MGGGKVYAYRLCGFRQAFTHPLRVECEQLRVQKKATRVFQLQGTL